MLGSEDDRIAYRDDHVDREPDQFGGELGQSFELPSCPAELDDEILSLHVSQVAEAVAKRLRVLGVSSRRVASEIADAGNLPGRLRLGDERRSEEAASQNADEGPAVHYSIT
jgi:hypothetical protein